MMLKPAKMNDVKDRKNIKVKAKFQTLPKKVSLSK